MDFFAGRLKELRAASGLSQSQLAKAAGLGLATVTQFEHGRREPTFGTLVKLARGLGVTLAAFDPDGKQNPPRPRRPRR